MGALVLTDLALQVLNLFSSFPPNTYPPHTHLYPIQSVESHLPFLGLEEFGKLGGGEVLCFQTRKAKRGAGLYLCWRSSGQAERWQIGRLRLSSSTVAAGWWVLQARGTRLHVLGIDG